MFPFSEVYGIVAPLRVTSGRVAMTQSYAGIEAAVGAPGSSFAISAFPADRPALQPEESHGRRAPDRLALVRGQGRRVRKRPGHVVDLVRPVRSEEDPIGADDGDQVAQGAEVVGDAVVPD